MPEPPDSERRGAEFSMTEQTSRAVGRSLGSSLLQLLMTVSTSSGHSSGTLYTHSVLASELRGHLWKDTPPSLNFP